MKSMVRLALAALLLFAFSTLATAGTITFDEYPATDGTPITTQYTGVGVTFDGNNAGTWPGLAGGDPGNWGVNGTNGPQFLGNNGENNYMQSIFFSTAQPSVSFDASRTNGSSAGQTLTADAFDASNNLLATETFTLGDINTWSSFSLTAPGIVRLDIIGSDFNGFSPYAIDNLTYGATPTPEPAGILMLGAALAGLAGLKRRSL